LIGSLSELDTELVYEFISDPYDPNSSDPQEILLSTTVQHSDNFSPLGEPLELDLETVQHINKFHEESREPGYAFRSTAPEDNSTRNIVSSAKPLSYDDKTGIINFMIIWSKQSECSYSTLPMDCTVSEATEDRMRALIDLTVVTTNTVFTLSKIDIQFELVHAYRHPTYKEVGDVDQIRGDALKYMAVPLDGELDDVQWKKQKYKAEMVSLLYDGRGGRALAIGSGLPIPTASFMFNVVGYRSAGG
jgi:hypothetical protein